jgi:hypothetical protein
MGGLQCINVKLLRQLLKKYRTEVVRVRVMVLVVGRLFKTNRGCAGRVRVEVVGRLFNQPRSPHLLLRGPRPQWWGWAQQAQRGPVPPAHEPG